MSSQKTSERVRWLFAELAVVFLAVFGAFTLDGCREQAEQADRRQQILRMLSEDFSDSKEQLAMSRVGFEQGFGAFLDGYKAKQMPVLHPIPIPTYPVFDTWGPILAAGGLDALDVELMRTVERVIVEAGVLVRTAEEYNAYLREVLVPNSGLGSSEYYQEDATLKPKYLWYYYSVLSSQRGLAELEASVAVASEVIESRLRGR